MPIRTSVLTQILHISFTVASCLDADQEDRKHFAGSSLSKPFDLQRSKISHKTNSSMSTLQSTHDASQHQEIRCPFLDGHSAMTSTLPILHQKQFCCQLEASCAVEMSEQSCQVCTSRPQTHTPCPDQALVSLRPLPVVLPYYSN